MSTERSLSRRGFLRASASAAGVAGASGIGAAAEEGGESGGGTTHTVEMTDQLVFDPDELTIAPGDTVKWVNVGSIGHSVTAYEESIPEGGEYFASGGFDSEQAARDDWNGAQEGNVPGGESYTHTFQTEGTYKYFCIPHEGAQMKGTIKVASGGSSEGGGGGPPAIPDSAKTMGIATTVAMLTTLGLAFTLLKYGGSPPEE
ncbi:MAG: plastocyanin/azurin family copper-binding protein [Halobacteriales archaeon]